ncbi:hypothetical protein LINPERPRIM_LOCUS6789, partial [Linum perenne]
MCNPIWWLTEGEHIPISINNDCQPIDTNVSRLLWGSLAQISICAPLRYEDWRLM